jgi:hypothetical protein
LSRDGTAKRARKGAKNCSDKYRVEKALEGFQDRMRHDEANDLQYIRQVLAVLRTSK